MMGVSFSPDGKLVASGSGDETVKILEVSSERTTILQGHSAKVESVSFSSDAKSLASCSGDKTVRIWVNINGGWYCDKIFSAGESPISALGAKVEQAKASRRNKIILKQLIEKDKKNETEPVEEKKKNDSKDEDTDLTEGEMKHNLALARDVANEFSEYFREKNIARHEELIKQKFMPLSLGQALAKPGIISRNQVAPGDISSKSGHHKQKSSCCTIF